MFKQHLYSNYTIFTKYKPFIVTFIHAEELSHVKINERKAQLAVGLYMGL